MFRFYAIAFPAYLLFLYALSGVVYHASCLIITPSPEDMKTIRDQHLVASTVSGHNLATPHSTSAGSGNIPDHYDLDPRVISKILASASTSRYN